MQAKVGLELLNLVGPPGRLPAEHNGDVLFTHGAAARRTSFLRFVRCARSDVVRSRRLQFFFFADAQSKNAERLPNKFPGFPPALVGKHALFTFQDWEKRERPLREAPYLLGFCGAAGQD